MHSLTKGSATVIVDDRGNIRTMSHSDTVNTDPTFEDELEQIAGVAQDNEPAPEHDADAEQDEELHGAAPLNDQGVSGLAGALASNEKQPTPAPSSAQKEILEGAERSLQARGTAPATINKYTYSARSFLNWCEAQGLDLRALPADAIMRFVKDRYQNAGSQNAMMVSIQAALTAARAAGVPITEQAITRNKIPRKPKVPTMPNPADNAAFAIPPSPHPAPAQTYAQPARTAQLPQPPQAVAPVTMGGYEAMPAVGPAGYAQAQVPPGYVAVPPPPQPQRAPRARATVSPVDGLPVGGKVVVSRKATGFEPGIPPGSLITVGQYLPSLVAAAGDAREFITRNIVPLYGPMPGGPDMIYVVERRDDRGNPMREPEEYAFAAPIVPGQVQAYGGAPGYPRQPAQAPQPQQMQQAQGPGAAPNDRLLEMIIKRAEDVEKRYTELMGQMSGAKDRTEEFRIQLELDKARNERNEVMRKLEEVRTQSLEELEGRRPRRGRRSADPGYGPIPPGTTYIPTTSEDLFTDPFPGGPVPMGGALGGLPPMAPPVPDQAMTLVDKLVDRLNVPPPAPPPPPQNTITDKFIEAALANLLAPKSNQPDPTLMMLLEDTRRQNAELRAELRDVQKSDKPKTLTSTLQEMETLLDFRERLGGGGNQQPTIMDAVMAAIENADKIGDILAKVAMAKGAPQLYPAKPTAPAQAPARAANKPEAPLPKAAVEAVIKMVNSPIDTEEGEQTIVESLFRMVQELAASGDAEHKKLMALVGQKFLQVDSKPEIRSMVTEIVVRVAGRQHATEAGIERVTTVLHKHYTELFKYMTDGKEKTLADAVPVVSPEAGKAPAPAPEQENEAEAEEEPEGEEAEGEEEEADTAPAAAGATA